MTLNAYTNKAISYARDIFDKFKLLDRTVGGNSTLAGSPAYTFPAIYEDEDDGPEKVKEVGTIIQNRAYLVTYYYDRASFEACQFSKK